MGVREREPFADEARVVIERGAVEEPVAFRIDEHLRAFGAVEHVVALPGFGFPRERIAQPGTAAGLDADPQAPLREAVLIRRPPCGRPFFAVILLMSFPAFSVI
jgi:hypothetical protein